MDDLFNIIIGIIVVYSFLSPFFSKKKPAQIPQKKPQNERQPVLKNRTVNTSSNSGKVERQPDFSAVDDFDILREVEALFKTETKPLPPKPKPQKTLPAESSADTWGDHNRAINEVKSFEGDEARRIKSQLSAYIPTQNIAKQESIHHVSATAFNSNQSVLNIIKDLRHPSKRRDFFIMSELLNKPKALRH